MGEFLISLLSTILGGSIVLVVGVRLALRRFYTERWWERKAENYMELVEAIDHVLQWLEKNLECARKNGRGLIDAYPMTTYPEHEKYREGLARLRRAASIGDFLLSRHAVVLIEYLISLIDRPGQGTVAEAYEHWATETGSVLEGFKVAAKRDLSLDEPPRRPPFIHHRLRRRFGHTSDKSVQKPADPRAPTSPKSAPQAG